MEDGQSIQDTKEINNIVTDPAIDNEDASHLEDEESTGGKKGHQKERRKIEIKFIENKTRRHVTFSKRKHGIMKKAFELSVLTGTQVLLLVVSETGLVYTFSTPKFEPIVTQQEGRNLIQACLNAPDEEEEYEQGNDNVSINNNNSNNNAQQQEQNKNAALLGVKDEVSHHQQNPLPMPQQQFPPQHMPQQQQQQQQVPRQGQYLNQEQNAVYQQYFQEAQQNHY